MPPFISIIIPTYNEAADIRATLDSLVALDYDDYEVLVVDASRDATPEIVVSYPSPKVRLILQSRGRGRAAARNEGILAARGEIIIILNADVCLPQDFIQRILPHYEAGADYMLVESRVTNTQFAMPRYVQALHEFHYPARPDVEARMNWTEGFSCRREAALKVGLIPEGKASPLVAGEDGWFGEKLAEAGHKKVFDHSIVVTHVMPADFREFWHQREGRGQGTPQVWSGRDGWSLSRITRNVLLLSIPIGLGLLIPIPHLWRAWRLSAFSPRGRADWLVFAVLGWIESAANLMGLYKGLRELQRS
jgi:cellulose synthase/poly-beta-1,6-N-acetylglucosamine synthase-like glycosyltransferase